MSEQKLTWKFHTEMISSRLASANGIISKCKCLLNRKWLMTFYNTFFMPHLNYCCIIWGQASSINLKWIVVLQCKVLKIILGLERRTHSNIVYSQASVLQLHQIYAKQLWTFMFKYEEGLLSDTWYALVTLCRDVVTRTTRANLPYYVFPSWLESTSRSLFHQGSMLWNMLDPDLRNIDTLNRLNNVIHELLLTDNIDLCSIQ